MPEALPSVLIPQIKSFLSQLSLLALLFKLMITPTTTFPEIESDLLLDVYLIVHFLTVVSDCVHSGDIYLCFLPLSECPYSTCCCSPSI
jgi:hypothetical protein